MEESSPLSILASMNSWFTPTILFIFLNLMIATILFTSNLPNNNTQQNQNQNQKQKVAQNENNQNDLHQSKLTRSPSILHRLRSFNFHPHKSQQYQQPPLQEFQQQELQQPLEVAATEYVFNHPLFPHDEDPQPISQNPKCFDSDPTNIDSDPTHPDIDPSRFEKQPKLETHFYEEKNHTIERVITHFNFGPDPIEKSDSTRVETDPARVKIDPTLVEIDQTRIENEDPVDLMDTREEENYELKSLDEIYSNITSGHVNRTKSDTQPDSSVIPVKLPAKMKKSASMKSAFSHFEEEKIVEARRPDTVRERRSAAEDDVEVDAKADDFINKFKHQLKLQRLDSIIRIMQELKE